MNINALSSTAPLSKPNQFKFGGKEFNNEFGLNWYSFGARNYDPQLGRWQVIDNLAENVYSMTPYRYAFNDPINVIDPDGNLEVPLRGYFVIQKNVSSYRSRELIFVRPRPRNSLKVFEFQSGNFETNDLTPEYQAYLKNPNPNALIRTSANNIHRFSASWKIMSSEHVGTDFRAAYGTPVYSLGDGKVVSKDASNGQLTIEYENGDKVTYRHLSVISNLAIGEKVSEGQIVAQSGDTNTQIAHLHIEAKDSNGNRVNFEEREYGTVSNEEFFSSSGLFQGSYVLLRAYKQALDTSGQVYKRSEYTKEEWGQLLTNIINEFQNDN